jgi:hypothetical protein
MSQIEFARLAEPFAPEEIEWRMQQAGDKNGRLWCLVVPYVTNRAIQQRLDDVCGPENWKNEFLPGPSGGVLCGISVRVMIQATTNLTTGEVVMASEWLTKFDGAENTKGMEGEAAIKGGFSAAMKRAAVQFGIGRYLYALEETFAIINERGRFRGRTKDQKPFRWDPPELPEWALPRQRLTTQRQG